METSPSKTQRDNIPVKYLMNTTDSMPPFIKERAWPKLLCLTRCLHESLPQKKTLHTSNLPIYKVHILRYFISRWDLTVCIFGINLRHSNVEWYSKILFYLHITSKVLHKKLLLLAPSKYLEWHPSYPLGWLKSVAPATPPKVISRDIATYWIQLCPSTQTFHWHWVQPSRCIL